MMRKARKVLLLGLAFALAGASAFAQVDYSKYEALGDSLTAGYASGALTKFYQDYSYPAIIAKQVGISSFQQPIIADPGFGSYGTVLILTKLQLTAAGISPVIVPTPGNPGSPTNATLPTPYNNLGIPGANTGDLIRKTGDITKPLSGQIDPSTIMYDFILRDGKNTALMQAIGAVPTFVTVWAGNNDVLGAATTGVAVDGLTLTAKAEFQPDYTNLLGGLRQQRPAASIVVGTIPDVTAIPFVTTIKPYIVNPANGSHIPLLGEAGPLTEQDYVTLGASSLLAAGIGIPAAAGGTGTPLPEGSIDATGLHAGVILRSGEITLIRTRTGELNDVIKSVAGQFGAKVVDFNAIFANIAANGYTVGGIKLTPAFLTGGIFSYDGVHPQRLGYAIVANEFIKVMNAGFGTSVPQVNLLPFLTGASASATTTVMAANTVFSAQAAEGVVKLFAPNADTSSLQTGHVVRKHVTAAPEGRDPVEPRTP
jgi:lysophospholipase L1-like esterase